MPSCQERPIESVKRKIRDAELRKIPYLLVVGDREAEAGEVSLREHRGGNRGALPLDDFVARVSGEIAARA